MDMPHHGCGINRSQSIVMNRYSSAIRGDVAWSLSVADELLGPASQPVLDPEVL
jgi:hypothetical protein